MKTKVAISIGDLNGIGIELALRSHIDIKELIEPFYIIDKQMLKQASTLLQLNIPKDFNIIDPEAKPFEIEAGKIDPKSGAYSFASFKKAVELCKNRDVEAICTLPIHKKAWELAGVSYKGHTDALRDFFKKEAIMMLGCDKMYVALYTEHIPLREVSNSIKEDRLYKFFIDFYKETKAKRVAVLGLNPHAGDNGVLGSEERVIESAINRANQTINSLIFVGALVPDVAFTPQMRKEFNYYIAMYHDQGLIPLKALYFEESINVSLNLPILRTSVDHGTAFDIAYKDSYLNKKSYINAIKYIYNSNRL